MKLVSLSLFSCLILFILSIFSQVNGETVSLTDEIMQKYIKAFEIFNLKDREFAVKFYQGQFVYFSDEEVMTTQETLKTAGFNGIDHFFQIDGTISAAYFPALSDSPDQAISRQKETLFKELDESIKDESFSPESKKALVQTKQNLEKLLSMTSTNIEPSNLQIVKGRIKELEPIFQIRSQIDSSEN